VLGAAVHHFTALERDVAVAFVLTEMALIGHG